MDEFGRRLMKSSTIKRSALSKESINVIENLAGENMELSNLYNNEEDNTPNEYLREETPVANARESKSKEIDLLWQSFKPSQFNSNSPLMCYIGGILTGIIATVVILVLFGALTSSDFSRKSASQTATAPVEESVEQETETAQEEYPLQAEASVSETTEQQAENEAQTPTNTQRYVIKDGDTVEAIIKHYYGAYTPERAEAIMKVNNLKNLDHISIGQVLLLPVEQ